MERERGDWMHTNPLAPALVGAQLVQSQGTQKRSLPVSSATKKVTLGVPKSTSA